MALTEKERLEVLAMTDGICPECGDELVVHDDGITSKEQNEWGISGAYVMCDSCGHMIHAADYS